MTTLRKRIKKQFVSVLNILPVSSAKAGSPRKCMTVAAYKDQNKTATYLPLKNETGPGVVWKEPVLNLKQLAPVFEALQQHTAPTQFILRLTNTRVWRANGAVITHDDVLLADVSREFGVVDTCKDHSVFYTAFQEKAAGLRGNSAVVTTAGSNVYYHWMLDVLPRILMLKESVYWDSIDHFIINYKGLPFQKETLQWLGIDESRIVNSNKNWDFHVAAEVLYIPSLPSKLNEINRFECGLLKKYFAPADTHADKDGTAGRIYISRKNAGNRTVVNEEELINVLLDHGFRVVEMERLSVAAQIGIFANASVITGPHGSAFANIVFCRPGTKLIEIMPETNIVTCFYGIASQLNLSYFAFIDEGVPINDSAKNDNIKLNTAVFKTFFRKSIAILKLQVISFN